VLDYHLHLWEHGPRPLEVTLEQVSAYCEQAAKHGVTEIALTEHLSRFRQADALLGGWWDDDGVDGTPELRAQMEQFWHDDLGDGGADLDHYVEVVLAAKREGLPVVLGLEVDFYETRMDRVARLLAGYPFDVLLGSVHWIGVWGFDNTWGPSAFTREWDRRRIEDVWEGYTRALEELADTGICDVLAHPDLVKIMGRLPRVPDEWYDRMAEAAARSGMAAEVSSAGWRKPVGEAYPAPMLLQRFNARGVPITTATDAHVLERVAERRGDVRELCVAAGYDSLQAYAGRVPREVEL
jgi:histidinol-phosphatase (PHP family)